jgi:septum formation protein
VSFVHLPAPLVLASTSKYRLAQLRQVGLEPRCMAPAYAEEAVPGFDARALVLHHARQKALLVSALPEAAGCLVLGGDQAAVLDGDMLGKPGTETAAAAQLLRLAGRTHELVTAIALVAPDGTLRDHTDVTRLTVRDLAGSEAEAYVRRDQPLDCAGSYRIEAAGPWLFARIEGQDPSAIMGLPLLAVTRLLREAGATLL